MADDTTTTPTDDQTQADPTVQQMPNEGEAPTAPASTFLEANSPGDLPDQPQQPKQDLGDDATATDATAEAAPTATDAAQPSAESTEVAEGDATASPSTSTTLPSASSETETESENSTGSSDTDEPATPEVAGDSPLDAPASDASPASEETTDQGDAPAQGDDTSKSDASSDEHDTSMDVQGDEGIGATHEGTDTPPVMVSHPCDPVTGKPLDGNTGLNSPPIFGGGQGPAAASPSGHVIPGVSPETIGASTASGGDDEGDDEGDEGDEGDDEGFETDDSDEGDDGEHDLETVEGIRGFANDIAADLAMLIDALDGFED